ncbi:MAG: ABC transporter ATP-binding protein [Cyanobacteria bacterium SID2]|nr:ABC transporter ATP-binding protein [Cyanobacteria bacterium SID2]MBP0005943.1 ABC transporter ATP-binding protein [Cyanobacteria bacterium SBC]
MSIVTQQLTGGYSNHPVIRNVSLNVKSGEWLTILGANGSGKSTLLRLLCRLLQPKQGVVLLDDTSIEIFSSRQIARKIAFLSQQQANVPEEMTVRELVSLGRSPYQPWWKWELSADDRDWVEISLQRTNLEDFANRPISQLSGGERQRAFLALALAQNPTVLLLDEPTTFLDICYQLELLDLLDSLNRTRKLSIVTVLHDINLAARYSHRIALVKSGQIVEVGTPVEVLTPENILCVFGVEAIIISTPVGLQVCPLRFASK